MTMTTTEVTTIEPLTHKEAMRLQAHELGRVLALLRSLDGAAWTGATDCPAWDVRAMCQHVLGACEAGASMGENVHQMRRARSYRKQHGGPLEAALSAVQVRERAHLAPAQIVERLAAVAPKTVRGRTRIPALVRNHGTVMVRSGELRQDGGTTTTNNGDVVLSVPGHFDLTSGGAVFDQERHGTLRFDISGASSFGTLNMSGGATLNIDGGTASPALLGGFAPAAGTTFDVITGPHGAGKFTTVTNGFGSDYSNAAFVALVRG
jgi:hypothetical protein